MEEIGRRGGTRLLERSLARTFIKGIGMGEVCASPSAHQCERSVPREDRSRAVPGEIRTLRGEIAGVRLGNGLTYA